LGKNEYLILAININQDGFEYLDEIFSNYDVRGRELPNVIKLFYLECRDKKKSFSPTCIKDNGGN